VKPYSSIRCPKMINITFRETDIEALRYWRFHRVHYVILTRRPLEDSTVVG
jgi:hypothetical protein